jgi:DNA-binding cell septation regulator SpoVG
LRSWRIASLVPALLLVLSSLPASAQDGGGTAPASTVERFLRLAAEKNYVQMGEVFGTKDGAILRRDPAPQVQRRMFAIANILENQRFVIRDEQPIPGRIGEAVQLTVQITQRGRPRDVPFVVVKDARNRWYVEQVDLEKLTRIN